MSLKVALSHDWLNGMRGGEKCLEVFCALYPQAPIFTLFSDPQKISPIIQAHPIQNSFLQNAPLRKRFYRHYLPFFSHAIQSFQLEDFDLVISTSHCVAKGIIKNKNATHICYCFTPVRYAWALFDEYFGNQSSFLKYPMRFILNNLKKWDFKASDGVDHFVAISHHVKNRIKEFYGRDATVIYPPVDTDFYSLEENIAQEEIYLVVSALVPYKKVDLAIQAFNKLGKKLVIIGDGPDKKSLMKIAKNNVQFLGWQPNEVLRDYYRRSKALIFPGEEDFGIVPLEAQACGLPVIAYAKGGALETIIKGTTGLFFEESTQESLLNTINNFKALTWSKDALRAHALRFSKQRFIDEIKDFIQKKLPNQK